MPLKKGFYTHLCFWNRHNWPSQMNWVNGATQDTQQQKIDKKNILKKREKKKGVCALCVYEIRHHWPSLGNWVLVARQGMLRNNVLKFVSVYEIRHNWPSQKNRVLGARQGMPEVCELCGVVVVFVVHVDEVPVAVVTLCHSRAVVPPSQVGVDSDQPSVRFF